MFADREKQSHTDNHKHRELHKNDIFSEESKSGFARTCLTEGSAEMGAQLGEQRTLLDTYWVCPILNIYCWLPIKGTWSSRIRYVG